MRVRVAVRVRSKGQALWEEEAANGAVRVRVRVRGGAPRREVVARVAPLNLTGLNSTHGPFHEVGHHVEKL